MNVGQLRAKLANLADDVPVEMAIQTGPFADVITSARDAITGKPNTFKNQKLRDALREMDGWSNTVFANAVDGWFDRRGDDDNVGYFILTDVASL